MYFQYRARLKKDTPLFEKIANSCQELKVSPKQFLDVMFGLPLDSEKGKGWAYPYLNYLSGETAKIVFKSRMAKYRARIGARDKVEKYIQTMSIANIGAWFGESFYNGFWSVHRALDASPVLAWSDVFEMFYEDPVFTPVFIVTHGKWFRFKVENADSELVKNLKERCRGEMNLMTDKSIANSFRKARVSKRLDAQRTLRNRHDERWDTVWKILG